MMTRAYYNEHDSFAADWLKMLIVAGLIAEGDVDTRSIEDVTSSDIAVRILQRVHLHGDSENMVRYEIIDTFFMN